MWNRVIYIAIIVLSGCVEMPLQTESKEIAIWEGKLLQAPDDRQLREKVVEHYNKELAVTGNIDYLNRAIYHTEHLFESNPDNLAYARLLYVLNARFTLDANDETRIQYLHNLYNRQHGLKIIDVSPPSMVAALLEIEKIKRNKGNLTDYLAALKLSLREKPGYLQASLMLSQYYKRNSHDELAYALLDNAIEYNPNDVRGYTAMYRLLSDIAFQTGCIADGVHEMRQAIKILKKAIKLQPENSQLHYDLALAYERSGLEELYLYEAEQHQKFKPDSDDRTLFADALLSAGKLEHAEKLYLQAREVNPNNVDMLGFLARVYFLQGKWEQSIEIWRKYQQLNGDAYFYGYLFEANAIFHLQGQSAALDFLANYPQKSELSDWELLLYQFHLEKIDAPHLLSQAKNRCEQTEANYYIGYRALLQNDTDKAIHHFKIILDEGVYAYNEYSSARHALAEIKKNTP